MRMKINGIELFYEKEGTGPPLILLHGNGEDHHIFDEVTERLADKWAVYRLDSRGHGQSGRLEELHYQDMADDLKLFIEALQLKQPILYGFSDGGIIGLLAANQSPELLAGMIISGANLQPRGLKPFFYWIFKLIYVFKRRPEHRMMLTEPSIRKSELQRIKIPVYITAGERDLVRPSHTRFLAEHIPKSKLRIIPGETHSSYVVHNRQLKEIIEEGAVFIEHG